LNLVIWGISYGDVQGGQADLTTTITFKIPGYNGSSLNKLIRIKIIALTNITLIETSVSVVYP
jgi:hypothetical protein